MSYQDGIVKQTEFFTTAELAQKLKMNVQVVTRKVQSGEIRAYKIGKEWRIPEVAVFEWLEGRTNRPNGTDSGSFAAIDKQSGPFHQSTPAQSFQSNPSPVDTTESPRRLQPEKVIPSIESVTIPVATFTNRMESVPTSRSSKANGNGASANGGTRRFLLEYILAQFEPHRSYQEHEVDLIIRRHGQDPEIVKTEMMTARMLSATLGKFTRRLDYQLASGS